MADAATARQAAPPPRRYPPPPSHEPFWPALWTTIGAIVLQLTLPEPLTVGPAPLMPSLEGAVLLAMWYAKGEDPRRRQLALFITAVAIGANIVSLGGVTHFLIHHSHNIRHPRDLIVAGVLIWLTNFILCALWYWELDRGGPVRRAAGEDSRPDFLFPQMTDDQIEPRFWRPKFLDYFYTSLTNSTAFSATDAMPLTPAAKTMMGVQGLVSLVTVGLIISRAVNIIH